MYATLAFAQPTQAPVQVHIESQSRLFVPRLFPKFPATKHGTRNVENTSPARPKARDVQVAVTGHVTHPDPFFVVSGAHGLEDGYAADVRLL